MKERNSLRNFSKVWLPAKKDPYVGRQAATMEQLGSMCAQTNSLVAFE